MEITPSSQNPTGHNAQALSGKIKPPEPRYAIVSMISDNVIGLGATFIASFVENFKHHSSIDLILLTSKISTPLSTENRNLIREICPRIIFREAREDFLTPENTRLDKYEKEVSVSTRQAPYLKFNLFLFTGYRRIVWIDSDTLILHDFSEVLKLPGDLLVVKGGPAIDEAHAGVSLGKDMRFNSGFMVIGSKFLNQSLFDKALELLNRRKQFILRDQFLLNKLFAEEKKLYLPHTYNWKLKKCENGWSDDEYASKFAKVIHFVGDTKWSLADPGCTLQLARTFHQLRNKHRIPLYLSL